MANALRTDPSGLCECKELRNSLSQKLGVEVEADQNGRYAGVIGAAMSSIGRR